MTAHQQIIFEQISFFIKQNYQVEERFIYWEADIINIVGLTLPQYAELTKEMENSTGVALKGITTLQMTTIGQLVNYIMVKEQINKFKY